MTGEIEVHEEKVLAAVESGEVGVGQLFRYLQVLPSFELFDAGKVYLHDMAGEVDREHLLKAYKEVSSLRPPAVDLLHHDDNSNKSSAALYILWRDYSLSSRQLSCRFVERFVPDFLSLPLPRR